MIDTYDFVHLVLLASGGEVKGRTMLQKKVYFMGVLCGRLEDLGYSAHYYGPFSSEVAAAMDRLKSLGFADQSITSWDFDHQGFEKTRYDLKLNKEGRQIAEQKKKQHQAIWKKLERANEILNSVGPVDYMRLSFAAKTYFMAKEKSQPVTADELTSFAKTFGWKVTSQQVNGAISLLTKMKLVNTTKNS